MHDYLFWAKMSPYMLLFDSYTFENFGKYFPNWHEMANSWQKMMFLRGKSYPTWLFHPAQLFSNQKLSILHIYSILHNYSIVKSNGWKVEKCIFIFILFSFKDIQSLRVLLGMRKILFCTFGLFEIRCCSHWDLFWNCVLPSCLDKSLMYL